MPRNRGNKKGHRGSDDELDDGYDQYDQYDTVIGSGKGGGGGGGKRSTPPPKQQQQQEKTAASKTPPPLEKAPVEGKSKHEDPMTPKLAAGMATSSSSHFRHGVDVYNRIFHDALPSCDFELGYEDRFKGLMWMPVDKFRHTGDETREIPFHRVYKYKYKGQLVWDRETKMDILDSIYEAAYEAEKKQGGDASGGGGALQLPVAVMPSLKSVPKQKKLNVVPKEVSAVPPSSGNVSSGDAGSLTKDDEVKFATFNILFDLFDKELIHTNKRIPMIAKALEQVDADIIAVQELRPSLYSAIRNQSPILCQRYHWTSLPTDVGTSQAILSKEPIVEAVACMMSKNKRCIFGSTTVRGTPLAVAAVHLISDHGGGDVIERRQGEMELINQALMEHPNAIMIGDFNFGDRNPETKYIQTLPFTDCYLATHGDSVPKQYDGTKENDQVVSAAGGYFTFDMIKNPVAKVTCKPDAVPRRLDRILVRGFAPKDYGLFATDYQEIATETQGSRFRLFPSDHFGVVSSVKILAGTGKVSSASSAGSAAVGAGGVSSEVTRGPEGETAAAMSDRLSATFFGNHCSALCIILPEKLHEPINEIRSMYDKAYPRWMPHINLLFPFVSPQAFGNAVELISLALEEAQTKPFKIQLNKTGHFNAKKSVVFLQPETDSSRPMHQLQGMLQSLFPLCRRNPGKDDEGAFQPHATLGQVDAGMVGAFKTKIDAGWAPVEFTVDCIHLIAKLEGSEKYEVMAKFDFPGATTTTTGGGEEAPPCMLVGEDSTDQRQKKLLHPKKRKSLADLGPLEERMVLEDPKYGNRKLSPYLPQDSLELWMLTVSRAERARVDPTHISQRGGIYHIPQHLLDTYLQKWAESVKLAKEAGVKFFMEEIRTDGAFRLYLDLDIKRCNTNVRYDGSDLLREIVNFTEVVFGYFSIAENKKAIHSIDQLLDRLFFSPQSEAEYLCANKRKQHASKVDVTCLVTSCHTPAQDGSDSTVSFKSGYRMYFQRIFVTDETYKVFNRLLLRYLQRQSRVPLPEHLPGNYKGWEEVIDVAGCAWNRARMFGTVKRRNQYKDVSRIHTVDRVLVSTVLVKGGNEEAQAAEEKQATEYFQDEEHLAAACYAQEVRIWDSAPRDGNVSFCNNSFLPQRLYGVWVVD